MTAISDSRTLQTPSLTILHPLREFFSRADSLKDLNKLNSLEYIVLYPTVGVSPLGGLKTPAPTKFTFHLKGGRTTFKSFYFSCFLLSFSYFNFPSFFSLQKVRAETIITLKTFQEYIFWWWCFLFLLLPMTRDTSLLEVLPASLLIFPQAEFSCFFCPLGFWIT